MIIHSEIGKIKTVHVLENNLQDALNRLQVFILMVKPYDHK